MYTRPQSTFGLWIGILEKYWTSLTSVLHFHRTENTSTLECVEVTSTSATAVCLYFSDDSYDSIGCVTTGILTFLGFETFNLSILHVPLYWFNAEQNLVKHRLLWTRFTTKDPLRRPQWKCWTLKTQRCPRQVRGQTVNSAVGVKKLNWICIIFQAQ